VKRVGILYHPMIEAASSLAEKLGKFLGSRGVFVWLCSAWEGERARAQVTGTDLVLSIGGDGTILRAAQAVAPGLIPITGINLGRLGFMTELSTDEAEAKLVALLAGEGWIDERAMLEAELKAPDSEGAPVLYALNDMVMARGEIARMVRVEAAIDGKALTTYRADGVILATATGSTGYSLSAGGPILHPRAREFLLLPILPHLNLAYTLVLPSSVSVRLRIKATHPTTLSVDGHINLSLPSGTTLEVKQSEKKTRFLRIHPKSSFYGSLEQRLKGKK